MCQLRESFVEKTPCGGQEREMWKMKDLVVRTVKADENVEGSLSGFDSLFFSRNAGSSI
jgi:hypothetical protein